METVITPEALKASTAFRPIKAKFILDKQADWDEVFVFIYPSADMANEANGDGELLEVHDFHVDLEELYTFRRTIPITPETVLYVRGGTYVPVDIPPKVYVPKPKEERRQCFWVSPSQDPAVYGGYVPSLVTEDEAGHQPMLGRGPLADPWIWGETLKVAETVCDQANEDRGITRLEAFKIVASSMGASRA